MKRVGYWVAAVLLLFAAAGCAKEEKISKLANAVVSEEYQQGNSSILKAEKGYYYFDKDTLTFRYYDIVTGKNIVCCNKPECHHDGNAFCAASIAKRENYAIGRYWLYSGRIFVQVVETTDTQYLFKLLEIALDGSEMNELVTYMTMEKTDQVIPSTHAVKLCIHRNWVVLPMMANGKDGAEDVWYYGTAILNLDTKEISYLNEEPLSKENPEAQGFVGYENYIYYYQKEGRKNILHRYSITDGTDESYTLQPGFTGTYLVMGEDAIVYMRSDANVLYVYHPSTKQTETAANFMVTRSYAATDETGEERTIEYEDACAIARVATDGTYLYAVGGYATLVGMDGNEKEELYVFVLNQDMETVTSFNIVETFPQELLEKVEVPYISGSLQYLGEEVYLEYIAWGAQEQKTSVYKCSRTDFLSGMARLEYVYGEELR